MTVVKAPGEQICRQNYSKFKIHIQFVTLYVQRIARSNEQNDHHVISISIFRYTQNIHYTAFVKSDLQHWGGVGKQHDFVYEVLEGQKCECLNKWKPMNHV